MNQFSKVEGVKDSPMFQESDPIYTEDSTGDSFSQETSYSQNAYDSTGYQTNFYDPEMSQQPRDRGRELNLEAVDLDECCEKGEWGLVKPLLDIHVTTVIKGPGCQPITPFIMLAMTITVWYLLSKIL